MTFEPGHIYEGAEGRRRVLSVENDIVRFVYPLTAMFHAPEEATLADFTAWYEGGGREGAVPLAPQRPE